jgi:hypothetical protein
MAPYTSKNTDTDLSGLNTWVQLMSSLILSPPPDSTIKSLDLQPLLPRVVSGVEEDMLITMEAHHTDGMIVGV